MAQTPALLRNTGELKPVIEEIQKQNKSTDKLKRVPTAKNVQAGDQMVAVMAKIHVLMKRDSEVYKRERAEDITYRKVQQQVEDVRHENMMGSLKKLVDTVKKSFDGLTKINKEALEETRLNQEISKNFEEENILEKEKKEEERHQELVTAIKELEIKGGDEKKDKDGFLTKLLKSFGGVLAKGLSRALVRLLPGILSTMLSGLGQAIAALSAAILGLPTQLKVAIAAALAIGYLIKEDADRLVKDIQTSEDKAALAASRGDLAGLDKAMRESNRILVERTAEDPRDLSGIDAQLQVMNTPERLYRQKRAILAKQTTPESKIALDALDAEEEKRKLMQTKPEVPKLSAGQRQSRALVDEEAKKMKELQLWQDKNSARLQELDKKIQTGKSLEGKTSASTTLSTGASLPVNSAKLSSTYGKRDRNKDGVMEEHRGVDLAGKVGDPILASNSGTVVFVGEGKGGAGATIKIRHDDGTASSYSHLSKYLVKVNDRVGKGQVIAEMGGAPGAPGAGNSEGPHLHFATYDKDGKFVDPKTVIPELASATKGMNVARAEGAIMPSTMMADASAIPEIEGEDTAPETPESMFAEALLAKKKEFDFIYKLLGSSASPVAATDSASQVSSVDQKFRRLLDTQRESTQLAKAENAGMVNLFNNTTNNVSNGGSNIGGGAPADYRNQESTLAKVQYGMIRTV